MLVAESYFGERNLKNDFGAAFRYLYTHPFWSLSFHFHIRRFFPFLVIVT